jgi:hypothetical protein
MERAMPDDYSQRVVLDYLRSEVDRFTRKAVETDDWAAKATYRRIATEHCDLILRIEHGSKPSN